MQKYRFLFLILLAFSVLTSCDKSQPKSGDAVFKANINGGAGMTILVQDLDPFTKQSDTLKVDGAGNVIISKNLTTPTYFNIVLMEARSSFVLFLHPGDTLFLSAQMEKFMETRKYSGNGAVYNNYLAAYMKSSNEFQQGLRKVFSMSETSAVIAMDSVRNANQKILDDLITLDPNVDSIFVKTEQARILYEWALLHNIYPMYYKYYTRMSNFETSPDYTTYLGECDVNDVALLNLDMYRIFLATYVGYKMEDYYADSVLVEQQPSAILYRLQLIEKLFQADEIKELMAYESVKNYISDRGIEEYDLYYDTFKKMCTNELFRSELDEMIADKIHLRKGAQSFEFSFVDIDGNPVSMSDFRGKYVYVDVWATWCNPCLAEIPHLKKLEEDFHDKNIVFVSISVDKTEAPWRKMLTEKQLQGVQIWAGQAPEFSQFYKIEGIPRFMLFDMEGNILDVQAKRPSAGIEKEIAILPGI